MCFLLWPPVFSSCGSLKCESVLPSTGTALSRWASGCPVPFCAGLLAARHLNDALQSQASKADAPASRAFGTEEKMPVTDIFRVIYEDGTKENSRVWTKPDTFHSCCPNCSFILQRTCSDSSKVEPLGMTELYVD